MDIQKIKELALENGFKLKEQASGNMDLNAYVYDFANAIEQAAKAQAVHEQVLDAPACVGGGTFQKGVKWSTVIAAAQRHFKYTQNAKKAPSLDIDQVKKLVSGDFVLVEKSKVRTWYQDDDEPENFCNSESDLDALGDCLDDDDIIVVNIHESAHISTRKVFGVWKSNSPTDIQSKFVLVDSREEAEEIVASNKAMIEAQEPTND